MDAISYGFESLIEKHITKESTLIFVCSRGYWKDFARISRWAVSFLNDKDGLVSRMVDVEKCHQHLNPGFFHFTYLQAYVHFAQLNNLEPYWINVPDYIKNYLLKEKSINLDDITTIKVVDKLPEDSDCICVNPIDLLPIEIKKGQKIIYLDDKIFERNFKKKIKSVSTNELSILAKEPALWKQLSGGRSLIDLNKAKNKEDILDALDPAREYDFHWAEHFGNQQFIIWGSSSFQRFKERYDFTTIPLSKLLAEIKTGSKYFIDFKLDENIDQLERLIAINPETNKRDYYWSLLTKKIEGACQQSAANVLFILDKNESEHVRLLFKSIGWYVPSTDASISRQLELQYTATDKNKISVFHLNQYEHVCNWLDEKTCKLFIEGLPLNENLIWAKSDNSFSKNEDSDETVIDSDIFRKLERMESQFQIWDYLLWKNNNGHQLYFLDPRINDYRSIRQKQRILIYYVEEWKDQKAFDKVLEQSRNFFKPSKGISTLNVDEILPLLQDVFIDGHAFRPDQRAYLERILPQKENMVVTLPTGGGKSVLFEAPALYRGSIFGRMTIIVSPLKALMQDHFNKLQNLGFYSNVDYINQDKGLEINDIYRRMAGGELLFLYITPERFKSRGFIAALNQRIRTDKSLEYCVFDEAHCISQWGNEFRPDYHRAAIKVKNLQQTSGNAFPVLLFSATVTEQVFSHLQGYYDNLQRIEEYSNYNPIRDHINISFLTVETDDYVTELIRGLKKEFNPNISRAIIFVRSRKKTEEFAIQFNEEAGHTFKAASFHAGMDNEERTAVYEQYTEGEVQVLFATKAFGMGMDIKNIHFIYHFGPSSNFEDFLQEIGRAGRDAEKLKEASFSIENPIVTKCFISPQTFGGIRDLMKENQMSWMDIQEVQRAINIHFDKHGLSPEESDKPLPVPTDIFKSPSLFRRQKRHSKRFQTGHLLVGKSRAI